MFREYYEMGKILFKFKLMKRKKWVHAQIINWKTGGKPNLLKIIKTDNWRVIKNEKIFPQENCVTSASLKL